MLKKHVLLTVMILMAIPMVAYPQCSVPVPVPNPNPPNPTTVDFCFYMDEAYNLAHNQFSWLLNCLGDSAAIIEMIRCDIADLNGGLNEDDMPLPNGMLDGNYELRVITELLKNPAQYANLPSGTLPGQIRPGVDPIDARDAFLHNLNGLYTPNLHNLLVQTLPSLWGMLPGVCPGAPAQCRNEIIANAVTMFYDIMATLAGYAVLDDNGVQLAVAIAHLLKTADVIGPMLSDLKDNPNYYEKIPEFLSKNGDADGDGYSNFAEYEAFKDAKGPGDAFIAAVLNPSIKPTPPVSEKVKIYPSGTIKVEEGGTIDLKVVVKDLTPPISYQWTHNGDDLGVNTANLVIRNVTTADAGNYQCIVTDASKAIYASEIVVVQVLAEGTIPVATGIGLAIITGVCTLGGVMALRRRR